MTPALASEAAASDTVASFWEESSLHELNAAAFGTRVLGFDAGDPVVPAFAGGAAPIPLPGVRDRLQRMLRQRRSVRSFGDASLSPRIVARILAAVGRDADGRRLVPSAGGLHAVHTFGIGSNVEGPGAGRLFRYDDRTHALQDFGEAPDSAEIRRLFQLDCEGEPQLILVFVAELGPTLRKYGSRGLRFVLQEAGHSAQNVGLRLAADGLSGYVLGGALDTEVLSLFGLAHVDAAVAGAMACGR